MKDFGYEDTQILKELEEKGVGFELNRAAFQRLRRRFSPRFLKDVAKLIQDALPRFLPLSPELTALQKTNSDRVLG